MLSVHFDLGFAGAAVGLWDAVHDRRDVTAAAPPGAFACNHELERKMCHCRADVRTAVGTSDFHTHLERCFGVLL